MSIGDTMDNVPFACTAAHCRGACEALLVAMLIYGLARSCDALADDQSPDIVKNLQPIVGGTPLPMAFEPMARAAEFEYSSDFRRRNPDPIAAGSDRELDSSLHSPSLQVASPWQRLADYRSQSRVQLLTLWASPRNMVSLQAGKRGGPSLQWSSRVMNRGGATRGLLDRFVPHHLPHTVPKSP